MLKPIETEYNGYRFRSRLEARWAVFFDTLGIKWEYEKEGYNLDGVWYLPDFWLPDYCYWIEIKGTVPTDEEKEKAIRLAKECKRKTVILYGNIPLPEKDFIPESFGVVPVPIFSYEKNFELRTINGACWCECAYCHSISFSVPSNTICLCDESEGTEGGNLRFDTPRLLAAYKASRSARFEYNERDRS